ncbi:TSP1 domain-containing protein TSP5 precursor [Cryptosporidium ubiquitum]|uniref:TSP1 domain-containing protein TSP5 n=1 Tax=Cryptosporidium ubiquitum TaxID=857276 RepID=A0A1J4MFL5_9CRYT|nr:TSP1 domain-containing protein TSP5 precursor [Cryptosporidium ubiquitum]OII73024.1 TSP1 domain-containing protein TSP5 precursor [Cryptosporidium ubiquitum]
MLVSTTSYIQFALEFFLIVLIHFTHCATQQKPVMANCPSYGSVSHGFFCLGLNKLKSFKTESWISCANECMRHSVSSKYRKCKYWSWKATDFLCTLKSNSSYCSTRDDSYVSGSIPTSMVGYCSTTCVVGEWSQWSSCTHSRPCGGYSERTRNVIFSPMFPGEICPNKSELRSCKLDKLRCPTNCPDYGIVTLGWGCSAFEIPGGGSKLIQNIDVKKCRDECIHNKDCVSWSHGIWDQSIGERSIFPKIDVVSIEDGVPVCVNVYNYIGCFFKLEGWISGNSETNIYEKACSLDCVTSMWSNWSKCTPNPNDRQNYKKRYRSIITKNNESGLECPDLQEKSLCDDISDYDNFIS